MFSKVIKDIDTVFFKSLMGISKKMCRLMVRAVVRFAEKIIQKKGNMRSRLFTLRIEALPTYGAVDSVLPEVPQPVPHRRHLWHQ